MYKSLHLKTLLLLACLVMGVSSARADSWTWTASGTTIASGSTFGSDPSFTLTINHGAKQNLNATKGWQYGSNGSYGDITLTSGSNFTSVSSIKVNASVNSGKSGSLNMSVGETTSSNYTLTENPTDYTYNLSPAATGTVTINLSGSSSAVYIKSITITYTTTPSADLESISLSGSYPTTFTEKDEFSHEGMTVTAHYVGTEETADVTSSATFSGYDMVTPGNQTVTVSYTENEITKTATYNITVNEGTKYTVSFNAGNGTVTPASLTESTYKGGVILPTPTCNVTGWTFAGWATSTINETETKPAGLLAAGSTYKPTENVTLYAVYKQAENENKFQIATQNSDITDGAKIVIASVGTNNESTLANNNGSVYSVTNFTPVSGVITCTDSRAVWTLAALDGQFTIENNGYYLKGSNTTVSLVTSEPSKWSIEKSSFGENRFVFTRGATSYRLEYNGTTWVGYNASSLSENSVLNYLGLTIYVSIEEATYATNPSSATKQTLSFDDDAIVVDNGNATQMSYSGQTVKGAMTSVTYTLEGDAIGSINSTTGVVELNGTAGTATITATAAAGSVAEVDYREGSAAYTITVRPCYSVTFSINGLERVVRETAFEGGIAAPEVNNIGNYKFVGWSTATVNTTDVEPATMTAPDLTPTDDNAKYYAVFAQQTLGDDEEVTYYSNTGSTATDATTGIAVTGNVNDNNGNTKPSFGLTSEAKSTVTFTGIDLSGFKSASVKFDYQLAKSGTNYTVLTLNQYDSENAALGTGTEITGTNNTAYLTTDAISLNLSCVKMTIVASGIYGAYVDNIIIKGVRPSVVNKGYTTLVTVPIKVTAAGYATFCSELPLDFTGAEVTAYTAAVEDDAVTFNAVTKYVPANAGILLKGDAKTYEIPVAYEPAAAELEDVTGNALVGVNENTKINQTDGGKTNFVLLKKDGVVGFFKVNATKGFTVGAHTAYLSAAVSDPAKGFFGFDDNTTAVNSVLSVSEEAAPAYNLQGQRVSDSYRGVVIVNGKKFVNK